MLKWKFEVVQYLVRKHGYHQSHTLHFAACNAHLETLEYCLNAGGNTEHAIDIEGILPFDSGNVAALHLAGSSRNTKTASLKTLLRHGANPLALTWTRSTALRFAGSCVIATHLVEHDFWLWCNNEGGHDPAAARKLLCTRKQVWIQCTCYRTETFADVGARL
jgi:hypothetical protein